MSAANQAVFLSYASQDAEAAKRIAEALRAAGVEVWFDQEALRGGDSWDRKIREQIRTCALFVPVISANTQSRAEGYFRLEWKLAVDRSHLMADDAPFLFPIVIGDIVDALARVPDKFREVQWTRLRQEETAGEIAARVARLLDGGQETGNRGQETGRRASNKETRRREKKGFEKWWWLVFPIMGMSVPIIGVLKRPARPERSPPPAATAPVQSEARGLVAKARHLFEEEDPSLRENLTLAEDLLLRAEKLDEFDGEVWAAHAQLSGVMMDWGIDRSDERRAAMRKQSDRAMQLAPDSTESQLAKAWFLLAQRSGAADAVPILEKLIERMPDDGRPQMLMGSALRRTDRADDAIRWFEKSAANPRTSASAKSSLSRLLYAMGRLDEADRILDESIAIRPLGMALAAKLRAQVLYRGDLDGAVETLKRIPSSLLLDERGAYNAYRVWLWRREPDKALRVLRDLPLDFIDDVNFLGPKAVLVAAAEELAGRPDLAKGSWEFALHQVEERLRSSPNDEALLYHRALCLTKLGQTAEAGHALLRLQQAGGFWGFCRWPGGGVPGILIKLGRANEAFDELESQGDREKNPGAIDWLMCARPVLSLNPDFDPVRDDPRFNAILENAKAAAADSGS